MKLDVAITDVSQSKKDLVIEVSADEVKAEFEKTYDAFARRAKVPGFRPGRVPLSVIRQRFSKDVKDEVIGRLLPHALQHAIYDRQLRVVGEPDINPDEISIREGEALKFKASVEILPDFELKPYKELHAIKRVSRVTDEDVERVIERWRESAAEFVPVEDRGAQDGDFVSIDLVGKYVETPEAEDLKADNVQIELGSENVQPEFTENLRDVKAGDLRQFRVAYKEGFSSQGLAGKTLDFNATVVAVRKKELPELDDDFAQGFGEYSTIAQMREKVRENLLKNAEQQADLRLREDLLGQILGAYDFEVPPSLVEHQATERTRELAYHLVQNGMPPQRLQEIDWSERMNDARTQAAREVRAALIVGRIGEAEGVKITEEELDAEIERIAESRGVPFEHLKERLTKDDALSSIESRLRYQKALDVVVNSADVTVEELTENYEAEQTKIRADVVGESQAAEKSTA